MIKDFVKPEVLAPAGDWERLVAAVNFGADAVYIGGKAFSLRVASDNFSYEEMQEGIEYAHKRGKKVYVAINIIAHNKDFENLKEYLKELEELRRAISKKTLSDYGYKMSS